MDSCVSKAEVFTRLRQLVKKLRMDTNAEFHVVLYTSIGKFVGDLDLPVSQDALLGFTDDPTAFSVDISAVFDGTDLFNSQLINMKNVIVYKHDSEEELTRADQMILFVDQILGFGLVRY